MEQEELNRIVAENMAKYRKAADLTQLELAERLNYSDKSVSKWEQGNGMPDVFVLYRLAEIYGVTVNDFLCRHEEAIPPVPDRRKGFFTRGMIMAMSVGLSWLAAVVVFVFIMLLVPDFAWPWLPFIYALPVTFIVILVLGCVWKFYIVRAVAASALIWTLLLTIYLTIFAAMPDASNLWMLFLIGIPVQLLVALWFLFRRKSRGKKGRQRS